MISQAHYDKTIRRARELGTATDLITNKTRCTPAQRRFITRLSREREHNVFIPNLDFVNKKFASNLIEQLLACPVRKQQLITDKQKDLITILVQTKDYASETVTERLIQHNVDDVSQLTQSQTSELLTALFQLPKLNNN